MKNCDTARIKEISQDYMRRLTEDKSESLKNSLAVIVMGFLWASISITCFISLFTNKHNFQSMLVGSLALFLIFILPGLRMILGGKKMKDRGRRYDQYLHTIYGGVTSIPLIAETVGISEKVASDELEDMVSYGMLPRAYINMTTREVVLPGSKNNVHTTINHTSSTEKRQKTISCPNCGAKACVMEGMVTKCEYCDTPLTFTM